MNKLNSQLRTNLNWSGERVEFAKEYGNYARSFLEIFDKFGAIENGCFGRIKLDKHRFNVELRNCSQKESILYGPEPE